MWNKKLSNSMVVCLLSLRPGESCVLGSVWQVLELDLLSDPLPHQKNNQSTNQRPLPPPTPARNSFSSPASLLPQHPPLTGSQNSLGLTGSVYLNIFTTVKVNHPVPFRSPESQSPITRGLLWRDAGDTEELWVTIFQPDSALKPFGALVK